MKLYNNYVWLRLKRYDQNMTIEEIAKLCNVAPLTIRRALEKHGLK